MVMREPCRNRLFLKIVLCGVLFIGLASNYCLARNYSSNLKQFLQETQQIYTVGNLKDKSHASQNQAYIDSTTHLLQTASLPDSTAIATLYDMAVKLSESRLYNPTIEYTKLARRFLQENFSDGLDKEKAIVNLALIQASAYQSLGMSTPAINIYFNTLEETKKYRMDDMTAIIYNNLGSTFQHQKEYAQADTFFNKAIQLNEAHKDKQKLFVNYNNLAITYAKQQNHDKALEYAFLAIHQLDAEKDKDMIMLMQQSIASIYLNRNEPLLALKIIQEVEKYQRQKGQSPFLIYTYRLLAQIYLHLNRTDAALEALQKAKQQADLCHNDKELVPLLNLFAKIYAEKNEYANAYRNLARAVSIKDSLSDIENRHQVTDIEEMYLAGQERNRQEAMAAEQARERNIIVYTLLGIIIAVMVVVLLRYRTNLAHKRADKEASIQKTHQQFKSELQQKEGEKEQLEEQIAIQDEQLMQLKKELTSLSIQSVQNENYIEKLNEEMKRLLLEINVKETEKRKHIKEIISKINQYNTQSSWEEFRYRFENVQDSFFQKLSAQYPDLTTNDQHLCALLRLGLSTKEIAAITFKEVRSIESGRNRLRKKLGLSEKEDLVKFLTRF